jgi:hypothetical protein
MAKVASIELSDFYGSVHEFYLALLLRKLFRRILPAEFPFLKILRLSSNFANFSAEAVSSARRMYSSLKVNIADGSIPIKATSEIMGVKIATFVLVAFASSRKP